MQTTIDIDEDILQAANERARKTGHTPGTIISEMARRGFELEGAQPRSDRAQPTVSFDPSFEFSNDALVKLLEDLEHQEHLGYPLIVDDETLRWFEERAGTLHQPIGRVARGLVVASLMEQGKWPSDHDIPVFVRRSSDAAHAVVTMELVNELRDEE